MDTHWRTEPLSVLEDGQEATDEVGAGVVDGLGLAGPGQTELDRVAQSLGGPAVVNPTRQQDIET